MFTLLMTFRDVVARRWRPYVFGR